MLSNIYYLSFKLILNYFVIKGQQKRRIRCFWGNSPCNGYKNKDEEEEYCDQNDVKKFFCDRFEGQHEGLTWSSKKDGQEYDYPKRFFKYARFL